MSLSYPSKALRRTAFVSTPGAPEPRVAPAALFAEDPRGVYTPRPARRWDEEPALAGGHEALPGLRLLRRRRRRAGPLALLAQAAVILAALAWAATVTPGLAQ